MNYKKLLPAIAILSVCLEANIHAQTSKKSYEISAFDIYSSLPANTGTAKLRKTIAGSFPGWVVTTDKISGNFTDVYGSPFSIEGNSNIARAQNCISQRMGKLNIDKKEWKQVSNVDAPKASYVNYTQVVSNHPVVFSWLSFRFTKTGELARIQMKNYGSPKNIKPVLTKEQAREIALKDLDNVTDSKIADWSWFPIPTPSGYDLHPAWQFEIKGTGINRLPFILNGYVDAMNGKILYRTNKVMETGYDLTVKGVVYKNGTLLPATSEALPYINLEIASITYTADAAGYYSSSSILLPQSTTIPLKGNWSTVLDVPSGTTPSFTNLVTLPGTTYTYPTSATCASRHINAYYHVNRVHDFMKSYFPSFTGMDYSLPTKIDVAGSCNAYYTGSDINFYTADGVCNSFAELGDVVYHEYGHGISDRFYTDLTGTSMYNGSLNEACSDIWALSITKNPILAQNSFKTYGGSIRRYDVLPQIYPIDIDLAFGTGYPDPHKNGQIIAGAWWDVGVNTGSVSLMTQLFTDVYYDVPDGPWGTEGMIYPSILVDALIADDDNSNLFDGTPHYSAIVSAFAKHGIYLEQDATLIHPDMPVQHTGRPITITANLYMGSAAFFHDLTLYYRLNSTGAWTPVLTTGSSTSYSAVIPAQPAGTIIDYYFAMHDALNIPNGYFPIAFNPTLPANQMNLTYQLGVGVTAASNNDFEGSTIGWKIGSNVGDNALSGLWQINYPSGTAGVIGPTTDHSGSSKCLTSGNGSSDTGVNFGTSSVLSPVIDISAFSKPVIEYYRWYSNDQGWYNMKNDPWIVKIRDASGTTWKTVEETYQGDNSWRRRIFPVNQYVTGATNVQLQFFASDSVLSTAPYGGQSFTMGAIDDFTIYDLTSPLNTNELLALKAEIFPNPADNKIQITLPAGSTGTATLYDMLGRNMTEIRINANSTNYTIDTRNLAAGQYNLVLQTNFSVQSRKIAVVHN